MPIRRNRRSLRSKKLILPPVRKPPRSGSGWKVTLKAKLIVAGLLCLLILVNLWVFVWGRKSIPKLRKKASAAAIRMAEQQHVKKPLIGSKSLLDLNVPEHLLGRKPPKKESPQQASSSSVDQFSETEARILRGSIRRGDNLYRALKRLGVARDAADEVVRGMIPLFNFRRARPGQTFTVRVSEDGKRVWDFQFHVSPVEVYRLERKGDRLSGHRVERPLDTRIVVMAGRIGSSVSATLQKLGEDGRLLGLLTSVFAWDLNFYTDIKKGDIIRMVVEKDYLDGRFYRYGRLLGAQYQGQKTNHAAFWFQSRSGSSGYYDIKGQAVQRMLLKTPVKYIRVSSKFQKGRFHPILHRHRDHLGVDFAAPSGTPIWASADGEIAFVGRNRAAGNMVVINHEGKMTSVYMHLLRFARGISKGVVVRQRQIIGYVGQTGLATGPHLHYGLKVDGQYVDPLKVRSKRAAPVDSRDLPAFRRLASALWESMTRLNPDDSVVSRLLGPRARAAVADLGVRVVKKKVSRPKAVGVAKPASRGGRRSSNLGGHRARGPKRSVRGTAQRPGRRGR